MSFNTTQRAKPKKSKQEIIIILKRLYDKVICVIDAIEFIINIENIAKSNFVNNFVILRIKKITSFII